MGKGTSVAFCREHSDDHPQTSGCVGYETDRPVDRGTAERSPATISQGWEGLRELDCWSKQRFLNFLALPQAHRSFLPGSEFAPRYFLDGNNPLSGGAPSRSGNGHCGHIEVTRTEQVASRPAAERALPVEYGPNDDEGGERKMEADGNGASSLPDSGEEGNGNHRPAATLPHGGFVSQPGVGDPPIAESGPNDGVVQKPAHGSSHELDHGGTQPPQALEDPGEVALTHEHLSEVLANSYESILRKQRERDNKSAAREKKDPQQASG